MHTNSRLVTTLNVDPRRLQVWQLALVVIGVQIPEHPSQPRLAQTLERRTTSAFSHPAHIHPPAPQLPEIHSAPRLPLPKHPVETPRTLRWSETLQLVIDWRVNQCRLMLGTPAENPRRQAHRGVGRERERTRAVTLGWYWILQHPRDPRL